MKFKSRGRHLEIPIIGYNFAELRLAVDRLVELRFRDEEHNECCLQLEDGLTVTRGKQETILNGSRPGKAFTPDTLSVLADNLGYTVSDAIKQDDGIIQIELSNKVSLSVKPQTGHEAWHLKLRRNGESWTGHLHGATGQLIG